MVRKQEVADATESPARVEAGVTHDTLLRGRVTLLQPARGFRASLDPVLLAGFLAPPHGRFLDIGCGTGAVSFLLLAADPDATGVGVEIQPRLAELAEEGARRNGFEQRLQVRAGDVRRLDPAVEAASFDLVATNPPFRDAGRGKASPDDERAIANHELTLALSEWTACAARAVRPRGRVAVVYAAERTPELVAALADVGLHVGRMRFVHPHADKAAVRVLVEARRGVRGPALVEPPLVVHGDDGRFSAEVRRMVGE